MALYVQPRGQQRGRWFYTATMLHPLGTMYLLSTGFSSELRPQSVFFRQFVYSEDVFSLKIHLSVVRLVCIHI